MPIRPSLMPICCCERQPGPVSYSRQQDAPILARETSRTTQPPQVLTPTLEKGCCLESGESSGLGARSLGGEMP